MKMIGFVPEGYMLTPDVDRLSQAPAGHSGLPRMASKVSWLQRYHAHGCDSTVVDSSNTLGMEGNLHCELLPALSDDFDDETRST